MVLWDGSPHPWFGPDLPPCCLMGVLDDATGAILAARHTSFIPRKEMAHQSRQNHFFAAPGISSHLRIPPMRQKIPRAIQDQILFLLGSIPLHAFAQLTYPESLRNIQACLRGNKQKQEKVNAERQDHPASASFHVYILGCMSLGREFRILLYLFCFQTIRNVFDMNFIY